MTTFEYTHNEWPDSSWVHDLYHNSNTNRFGIVAGEDYNLYVYENVTYDEYRAIADADSVGAAYNAFKQTREGSANWGPEDYVDFVLVDMEEPDNYAVQEPVTVVNNYATVYQLATPDVSEGTDEVPADAPLAPVFELAPAVFDDLEDDDEDDDDLPDNAALEVVIHFVYQGLNRKYTTHATGLNNALSALDEVGDALGLKLEATKVEFNL